MRKARDLAGVTEVVALVVTLVLAVILRRLNHQRLESDYCECICSGCSGCTGICT